MSAAPAMSNGANGVHEAAKQAQNTAELVGNQFVSQFYTVLHNNPAYLYRFYTDESTLTHADAESGSAVTVKSQKAINERVKQAGFQEATTQIWSVDSQYSKDEGVLVMVTGSLHCKGKRNRDFVQSFFLAVQEKGYFVLNDTFRYLSSRTAAPQTPTPKEAGFHAQAYDKQAYQPAAAYQQQQNYYPSQASPHPASLYPANGAAYNMPTPSPVAPQQSHPDRVRGHAVTPSMHPAKPVGPPPPTPAQQTSHPTPPSPQPVAPSAVEAPTQEAAPQQQQPPPPPAPPAEEPKPVAQPPKPISQPPKPISQPPKPISQPPQPVPQQKPVEAAAESAAPEQAAPQPSQAPAKQEAKEAKPQQAPPQQAAPQKPAQPAAPAAPLTYAERLRQGKPAAPKAPAAPKPAPTPAPVQQTQAPSEAPEATPSNKAPTPAPEASTTTTSPPVDESPNSTVFVKTLPEAVTLEKLEEAFARFGAIKPKGIHITKRGYPGDYAFVEFEEVAAMQAALEATVLIDGKQVQVKEKNGFGGRPSGGEGRGYRGRGPREFRGRGEGRGRNGPRGEGRFPGGRGDGGRGEGGRGEGREGGPHRPRSYSGNFPSHDGSRPEGGKPGSENLSRPRPEGRGRGGRGGSRGGGGSNPPQAPQQAPPQTA